MERTRPRGFIDSWKPRADTTALIAAAQTVLDTYRAFGPMTLRQIFYRLVATVAFPKTETDYKRLGEVLQRARRARIIPFEAMRDDTLTVEEAPGWTSAEQFLAVIGNEVQSYALRADLGQPVRHIVMVEAAGMLPMVRTIVRPFGADVRSAGGFSRATGNHDLALDIAEHYEKTKRPTRLLHVGDFDPSGEHIHRAFFEDIAAFVDEWADPSLVMMAKRVALIEDQIIELNLPTAPAKATDRRSFNGVGGDGTSTVQAEALAPDDLAAIIESALVDHWDAECAEEAARQEAADRNRLAAWLASAG